MNGIFERPENDVFVISFKVPNQNMRWTVKKETHRSQNIKCTIRGVLTVLSQLQIFDYDFFSES
jgi:hypothetical protein